MRIVILASNFVIKIFDSLIEYASLCMHQKFQTSSPQLFLTPEPVSQKTIFPGNSTGVNCHFLFQGIFPTQGSNPGLPHCRQTLCRLRHQGIRPQGKSEITGVGSLSLLLRIFPTQESNHCFLHCRRILYQLSCQGSPTND